MSGRSWPWLRAAASVASLSTLAVGLFACPKGPASPQPAPPAAAAPAQPSPADAAVSQDDGDPLAPVPPDELTRSGCGDPHVVCVDACTGRLTDPMRVPLVAEGQEFVIRSVGWASCRPQEVACTVRNVPNVDVYYRGAPVLPALDGGAPAPTPSPSSPPPTETIETGLVDLKKSMKPTIPDGGAKPPKVGDKSVLMKQEKTEDAARAVSMAESAVRAHRKRPGHLGAANLMTAAATDIAKLSGAQIHIPDALSNLSCSTALRDSLSEVTTQTAGLKKFETYAATLGDVGTLLARRVAKAQDALTSYGTAAQTVCGASGDAGSQPSATSIEQLESREMAANDLLDSVESDAKRAQATHDYVALERKFAHFGDCVVAVPTGSSNRQIAVDIKLTPVNACESQPSNPSCPQPQADGGAAQADGGEPPEAAPPGDGGPERAAIHALVYANIDHGKYYWDLGVLFAVVPMGQRTVTTPQVPGISGSQIISVDERGATLTGIALNVYPLGHRREAYSFLEDRPRFFWRGFGDAFGMQLAFNPDLTNATSTLFGGVLFEPITGLSLNVGAAFLQGDFLKAGYSPGMAPPANRSDYVVTSTMLRFYFGVTLGYELIHTTTAQLPTIKSDLGE
jgi:hypothetical protein